MLFAVCGITFREELTMGIIQRITAWGFGRRKPAATPARDNVRRCHFETMEPRRVLSADPVVAGVTYHEGDGGQDTQPDYFQVTFEGGSARTFLGSFTINGDQDGNGAVSRGDNIFDVGVGGPGVDGYHAFRFDATNSVGISASDVLGVNVSADGLRLTVNVRDFQAGDKLAFTIDVDEIENFALDPVTSGVEFEGTTFAATFVDQHYTFRGQPVNITVPREFGSQPQQSGIFYDYYDQLVAEGSRIAGDSLTIRADNNLGQQNRSAASIDVYELVPKPITISGQVYHDEDADCTRDGGEQGIAGVQLTLQRLNTTSGNYETVANTTTNANGQYQFGLNLNLQPGTYRVIETQPSGYLDVGAEAGKVAGVSSGTVQDDAQGNANVITSIQIPLGGTAATNYDFCEVRPAQLSGRVWHDRNDNGRIDSGEEGLANVMIRVTRTGAKDASQPDPFAGTAPIFVRTGADGSYSVTGLPPGLYEVVEINNYPGQANPLAGYLDGQDSLGNVGGTSSGTRSNDRFSQVELCAGDAGVQYNFGELRPNTISGHVGLATPDGDCVDPASSEYRPLAGVTIRLLDQAGNLVATTQTNAQGQYEFTGLRSGVYTVVEVQPAGYLDGEEDLGMVDGQARGQIGSDRFSAIALTSGQAGTQYNFCEHVPASISGHVWHDKNDNGVMESGEQRLGGVRVELFDAAANRIADVRTDANGFYEFNNLYEGTYSVREVQPTGFVDGKDSLGTVGGTQRGNGSTNDQFRNVLLRGGDRGVNYDFGEIRLGSLTGQVFGDVDGDCVFDASQGDRPLAGVTLILLDASGNEVTRTLTDRDGRYAFDGLRPGTYTIREIQPDGYLDSGDMAGKVGGETRGTVTNDRISNITLTSGDQGVNYDFCEDVPAEICGVVYHDRNNNGVQDTGEEGIAGVVVKLLDANENVISEMVTDASGKYCFTGLRAGEYCVHESQPAGYVDGKDSLGSINGLRVGTLENDDFCNITLRGGQKGENYNFGEIRLASISGYTLIDADGNCRFSASAGDTPVAGVTMQLLDASGNVLATTVTAADGSYRFDSLLPGTYSVRQVQPGDYFTVDQMTGMVSEGVEGTGDHTVANIISGIQVSSGQNLIQYNFCEDKAAEIHGRVWEDGPAFRNENGVVPSGYRGQRDGVFQAGTDTPLAGVTMRLYWYIDPVAGAIAPRPVRLSEVLGADYAHLGGNPNAPVWVTTDANGQYSFTGLKAGNYIVLQEQPGGYTDANDVVGSTTGFTFNSEFQAATAPQALLSTFSVGQVMDSVANIRINAGGISVQNNFTEVRAVSEPRVPFFPPTSDPPIRVGNPQTPFAPLGGLPGLGGSQPGIFTRVIGSSRGAAFQMGTNAGEPFTWHLSVINAGQPRAAGEVTGEGTQWLQAAWINSADWDRYVLDQGEWTFATITGDGVEALDRATEFGMFDGVPLAGDFDGDGIDELAIWHDGYWMIDINRNGQWDREDLLARLGDADDTPVVGDWDGDGKADIGIYGPIWEGDAEAIANEPGLPNPDNRLLTKPKNVPPAVAESTSGARFMKLTAYGTQRADLVDHVFGIDEHRMIPVTGDWNGNGIRAIGTFEGGQWRLDINGDGRFDSEDRSASFGQAGDIPLVGDFDGDGISQLAVFRDGTWIIDADNDQRMGDGDVTVHYGTAGDTPVVGDWNGDGVDDIALYRASQNELN